MHRSIFGKDRLKVLFIRAPRYIWTMLNESDTFAPPLGYACLSAFLREKMENVEVKIIDCPPNKIGWKTLEKMLSSEKPDVVGVGDEAVYHAEGVKVLKVAKAINPDVITIAGGHYFSWTPKESLSEYPIDYIVRFEGEATLVELLETLRNGGNLSQVKGIAYKEDGQIIRTPPRPLLPKLDDLPIPAYDLLPLEKYSPRGYFGHRNVTIQSSRGCPFSCDFCSCWTLMGEHWLDAHGQEKVRPKFRRKSVERTIAEVDLLWHKYGRRTIHWVDDTWNVDPQWSEKFCDELLKRNFRGLQMFAYMRSDFIVRDEKLGVLEKMAKAGLAHVVVGIERARDRDFLEIRKAGYSRDLNRKAFQILRKRYPQIVRRCTVLTGLRNETRESLLDLVDYCIEVNVDFPGFHPLTPLPGTLLWEEAQRKGWIEEKDFRKYDWFVPTMSSEHLSRGEIAKLSLSLTRRFFQRRPWWIVRGLFSGFGYRREIYFLALLNSLRVFLGRLKLLIFQLPSYKGFSEFFTYEKPSWYDS